MNAAWGALLADAPVLVERDKVTVGDHSWSGDNLACLMVRPHPKSATASVGVIAGTGLPGLRLTDRLGYFTLGVGFPDLTILSSDMLLTPNAGVKAVGFFDSAWRLDPGHRVFEAPATSKGKDAK